ncbi:MAG: AbrB/MazE/SpoVT family DNA-binding domain-containing protein [Terriglobales bacterium]
MRLHSTLTSKGQTTIPRQLRQALELHPGDRLEFVLEGRQARVRKAAGAAPLAGSLASERGRNLDFAAIRRAAARRARR